jgi:hypothetical protein
MAMKATIARKQPSKLTKDVGKALKRAAKSAERTARMYGTPIYESENGKVVAKRP